jgi:uncharacterized protein YjiS (DUF1127 family)
MNAPMPRAASQRAHTWRDKTWRDKTWRDKTCRAAGDAARPPAKLIRSAQEWLALLAAWFEARDARRRLMDCHRLDARFAKDVGLTPAEIEAGRIEVDARGNPLTGAFGAGPYSPAA